MSARGKRATIKDVAAFAGVSVTTVSFVLNGRGGSVPAPAERVRTAAKRNIVRILPRGPWSSPYEFGGGARPGYFQRILWRWDIFRGARGLRLRRHSL
ncbi:MAG: LacI family DNA-binding transcriptional regulator [Christensenellaceae bacterium]